MGKTRFHSAYWAATYDDFLLIRGGFQGLVSVHSEIDMRVLSKPLLLAERGDSVAGTSVNPTSVFEPPYNTIS